MHRSSVLAGLAALVLFSGCGQLMPGSPSASQQPPVQESTASTGASPVSASPTADATSAAPTPSAPALPSPSGALDVSRTVEDATFASFASPSGKIWCAFYDGSAMCNFPVDYTARIPSTKTVCPEEELNVSGVEATSEHVDYFCSGDSGSSPQLEDTDNTSTSWWKATGWPSVKVAGQKLAILPYGKSLVAGDYVCASATNGITCGNTVTGRGFRMARAGVVFIR